ncbi:conserved hypothetical protein [Candidatus Desulfosporosinus infrequens]|uniref:Winged helix-turn helix domain-containing protein n=1 Tax=Candidatus Desulfosporosinus infrequens TaxID=2043169 RepID=A0A2U3K629_9FIRM|nr:conserved hypothetical protein [Candidatus Desulfosporosinus infrequens]
MARSQKPFSEEQKVEIQEALKRSKNTWEQKRLMILNIRAEKGSTTEEIANMLKCSKSNVTHTITNYFREGLDSIKWTKKEGNRRNLKLNEESEFLKPFLDKAEKGQMLIVNEIKQEYQQKIGHTVPHSTIYRVLKRQGWRKIMPRSKHPKSKPEEFGAYKKNQGED